MLRVAVMVSGGGTNLQAIIDAVKDGTITNTELVAVISNNAGAYALTRAKDNNIPAYCISPKDYESRDAFNDALLDKVNELNVDLIVLAGFLDRPTPLQTCPASELPVPLQLLPPSSPPGGDGTSGTVPPFAPRWNWRSVPPPAGPAAPPHPESDGRWSRWSPILRSYSS